jgi:hypothetical protein
MAPGGGPTEVAGPCGIAEGPCPGVIIGRFRSDLVLLDSDGRGDESPAARDRNPASAPQSGGAAWEAMRGGDLDDEIPF